MRRLNEVFRPDSGYKAFFLSMATFALAFGLYKGVIDNYLAEVVSMSAFDKGVSEFFRELPGLLLVFILAVFYYLSAEQLYRVGAVIMLAGMAAQSVVPPTRVLVILCIFVFSLGDHIQLGMRNTLSLEYAEQGRGGEALGFQNAVYQIGMLVSGTFSVWAIVAILLLIGFMYLLFRPYKESQKLEFKMKKSA